MDAYSRVSAYFMAHFDKVLHFAGGSILASATLTVALLVGRADLALIASSTSTSVVLLYKEFRDSQVAGNFFDPWDLFWGLAGSSTVWLPYIMKVIR